LGHFINDKAVNYDLARESFLREKLGLKILRFTNLDVTKNFEGVCKAIEEALR
jgi:very-short-patch-repair endonuclease